MCVHFLCLTSLSNHLVYSGCHQPPKPAPSRGSNPWPKQTAHWLDWLRSNQIQKSYVTGFRVCTYTMHARIHNCRAQAEARTHTHSCSIMQESPHTHTHSRTVPLRVSALWEICLLEEDITSRHQPALPSPARQTELPWLRQWKIKTTLTGVQSIMEIQKPSSSCEWVMRRREVGGGRRGVVIFADGIIARQRGEANRQMDSGSKDSSFFFLNFS